MFLSHDFSQISVYESVFYIKISSKVFPKNGDHPISLQMVRKWTSKGREHFGCFGMRLFKKYDDFWPTKSMKHD